MKRIEGWRTFIVTMVGIGVLFAGLWLVMPEHRKDVFVFFAGSLVGLAGAQVVKSVGTQAVNGEGLKKGLENLMTPSKPGGTP